MYEAPYYVLYNGTRERVASFDSLVHRLDELGEYYGRTMGIPYGVDLVKDNGQLDSDPSTAERLCIGIGKDEWIIFYCKGDEMCRHALGDVVATGTIVFYFGDWTELSRKYLIPRQLALRVIETWIATGELSNSVIV